MEKENIFLKMYCTVPVLKAGHPGVPSYYNDVCLSGLWLGGLLYLSFLSYFFKLVCYAHVFPCKINDEQLTQLHTGRRQF